MPTIENACDGPNGSTLTVANSDDNGGTALSNVTGPWTFSSVGAQHAANGWRCQSSGTAWRVYFSFSGVTTIAVRQYFTFNTLPNAARDLIGMVNATFGTNMRMGLDATNHLQVKNAAGSTLFTATAALSAATGYRVEWEINTGTGTTDGSINFRYYLGDSTSPIQSYSASNVNMGSGSTIIRYQLGNNDAVSIDITYSQVKIVTGSTTPIGPFSTNLTVSLPIAQFTLGLPGPSAISSVSGSVAAPNISFTAPTPNITSDVSVPLPVAQLSLSAPVPNATAKANVTVGLPVTNMAFNALSPSISVGGSITVSLPPALITFEAPLPNVSGGGTPGRPGFTTNDAMYAALGGPVKNKTLRDLFVEKVPNVVAAWGVPGDTYVEAEMRKYDAQPGETIQDARSRYYHNNDL